MYRIIGADGREYGPVSEEQLRQWIVEGRANAQTRAAAEGSADWRPLSAYPAFSLLFAPAPPAAPAMAPAPVSSFGTNRRTSPYAITGLVLGILSICLCCCCHGLPFNLAGLIFSILGLMQIKDNPELYEGNGYAVAGLVLSILSILWAFGLIAFWGASGRWEEMPYRMHRL